ncbi:unnamed protein product, partial [Urochloa humidicola]
LVFLSLSLVLGQLPTQTPSTAGKIHRAGTTDSRSPAHITLTHSPPTPRANPSPIGAPHCQDFAVLQAARAVDLPPSPAPKKPLGSAIAVVYHIVGEQGQDCIQEQRGRRCRLIKLKAKKLLTLLREQNGRSSARSGRC